jgi:hypothetical protein
MPIVFKNDHAFFRDAVSVEEAEGLLEWLQQQPSAKVDLSDCCHLHTANLQVLMAAKPTIFRWPEDARLRAWLVAALPPPAEPALPPPAELQKSKLRAPNRRHSRRATSSHKEKVTEVISEIALEPVP